LSQLINEYKEKYYTTLVNSSQKVGEYWIVIEKLLLTQLQVQQKPLWNCTTMPSMMMLW